MNEETQQVADTGHYRLTLTVGDHTPRHVRRVIRGLLASWSLPSLAPDAELIVTELLTNVHRHVPDRHCVTTFARTEEGDGLWLGVHDGSDAPPVRRHTEATDAEGGRGLALVAAVADKWGVEHAATGGKTVWCELRLR